MDAIMALYDSIVDKNLLVWRITVAANNLIDEAAVREDKQDDFVQLDLFTDYEALEKQKEEEDAKMKKERAQQVRKGTTRLEVTGHNGKI